MYPAGFLLLNILLGKTGNKRLITTFSMFLPRIFGDFFLTPEIQYWFDGVNMGI